MAAIPTIKVWAANETVQKYILHPLMPRVKFPSDITQPQSWPDDSFTKRMIRDGEILTEPPKKVSESPKPVLTGTIAAAAEVAPAPKKGKKE